jgi:hypothetical protein
MSLFRRRVTAADVEAAPIPVPLPSIDGWTLAGTPLAAKLPKSDLRELETLLHGIHVQADTPYTYERAAILLERAGELGAALSVCAAWAALPAARWPEYVHHSRSLDKRRSRLRSRLAASGAAASPAVSAS